MAAASGVFALSPDEETRVTRLLAQVEASERTAFIRNGREHTARDAAEFLRRKCGGRLPDYDNAEQFVRECAAKSSTSGGLYRIRLAGETEARASADVLGQWLAAMPK